MIVGFTGTREGMKPNQYIAVTELLKALNATEGHHGDCAGADAQFGEICDKLGIAVTIHPPVNPRCQLFAKADVILPQKEYIKRDKDIVDVCNVLIACPKSEKEERRSGTWTTIRYAKKKGRECIIVYPEGSNLLATFC